MSVDAGWIVSAVSEFYTTENDIRRQELNEQLCTFQSIFSCEQTISACILLLHPSQQHNVQYFGALSIYDTIRQRWEECVSEEKLSSQLKNFLVENLSTHAATQMQSITNKLSASLALLALYSIPDVWPQPIEDLTSLWASSPELLLRVLAEIAAEFSNVQMPLTQRGVLKTELLRMTEYVIRIVHSVLTSSPTPSCLNAAVECVEQWLRLPGTRLDQWTPLLSIVFMAVSGNNTALTNLLNILAVNDELTFMEQLLADIAQYAVTVISEKICIELLDDSIDCEETIALVAAVCTIMERAVPTLIRRARTGEQGESRIKSVCSFLLQLSSWPGVFAVDEAVSDLPAVFFTTLREELQAGQNGSPNDSTKKIIGLLSECYACLLKSGVEKLGYPKQEMYNEMDKEQREQFHSYRTNRSELSVDSCFISGPSVLEFLNESFVEAYENRDVFRQEACLFLWENVADYLTESDYPAICTIIEHLSALPNGGDGRDVVLFNKTLMRLLYALSHLISEHDQAVHLESVCIRLILPNLARSSVCEEALRTLDKFVHERSEVLMTMGDEVSNCCYQYFMNDNHPQKMRLAALKCIGYILSMRPAGTVMEVLSNVLAPYVSDLDDLVVDEQRRIFQIAIFSCLFTSLPSKNSGNDKVPSGETPVVLILRQTMPVLRAIAANERSSSCVIDKVLDASICALCALDNLKVAEFFLHFCSIVDVTMERNTANACSLTKQIIMACGRSQCASSLCEWLSKWVERFDNAFPNASVDEWISLVYQIVKKEWKLLQSHPDKSLKLIEYSISLAGKALSSSEDPNVVKYAAQCLSTISNQSMSFGDAAPKQLMTNKGTELIKIVFSRIQSEMMRQTVEALAEVLFFFVKEYPMETRQSIQSLEHSDSSLVAALFRSVGNLRNFKQMAHRFNLAARKDKKSEYF